MKRKVDELKSLYLQGKLEKRDFINAMHEIHALLFDYSSIIKDTDIASIEIRDEKIIMTSRESGIKMICDVKDKRMVPLEILNFGTYEKSELAVLRSVLKDNQCIFDVGANIGWYSMNLSRMFDDIDIYAFEPVPHTYSYLIENIKLNHIENIHTFNFGFSEKHSEQVLFVDDELLCNASLKNLSNKESINKVKVLFETIDEFVLKNNVRPNLIKCDVEGAELLVFKGGIETLKTQRPIVFTEMLRKWTACFDYHPNDIIAFFKDLGYRCYVSNDQGKLDEFFCVTDETIQTNYFFIHPESR